MASLNTLRTKGGIIVSIVIGLALLAFLLGDLASPRSGILGNNKMNVGEICGTAVDYMDYSRKAEEMNRIAQLLANKSSLTNEEVDQARNMAWESMISQHALMPGFDAMGIAVGEAEQIDMMTGVYISPVIAGIFTDPATGVLNKEALANFVANRDEDPSGNAPLLWQYFKEQAANQRVMGKFVNLVAQSMTVNKLEVEQGVHDANNSYVARYVSLPYHTIADSTVHVADSRIREYYNKNKESFRQGESRDIEYVLFELIPSAEDYAQAEQHVAGIAAEFATAADPMQYAQANSQQAPNARYVKPEHLDPALREAVMAGDRKAVYGPVLGDGDVYSMARYADSRMMPDSVGAKVIVLQPTDTKLADSLVNALRKGGDFAAAAMQYSLDKSTPDGDFGIFPPEVMPEGLGEALMKASKGDVFSVNTPQGLFVATLTYKTAPVLKVKVATLIYAVEPSQATDQAIYAQASAFLSKAAGSTEKFNAALTESELARRVATIRNTDRAINGLGDSRELIHWAYNHKKGEVSAILELGGDYVVATLTGVSHQGIATIGEAAKAIRPILVREEKARMLGEKLKGESLDQIAATNGVAVAEAADVQYNSFYIDGAGVEMRLIGAICGTKQAGAALSKPVEGMSGVYVFGVTAVNTVDNATPESEKVRIEATSQSYLNERIGQALMDAAKVTDMRIKFF